MFHTLIVYFYFLSTYFLPEADCSLIQLLSLFVFSAEIGAALLPATHEGWPHLSLSYAEVPVSTALHTAALMHPALHAQLPVSRNFQCQTLSELY